MAPDDHSARSRTLASLEGLGGVRTDALDAGGLLVVLNVLGDALRLGMPIPSALWRPLDGVGTEKLGQCFAILLAEARAWRLPPPGDEDDEAAFQWSIQRRDEIESVVLGARRLLLARGATLDQVEEWRALDAVLRLRDVTCGGARGRIEIEEALGERAAFATETSWVAALPELEIGDAEVGPAAHERASGGVLPASVPADEVIDSYLRLGHRAASIERTASEDAAFAEELEAMIDAAIEVGMSVGLVARRWRRSRSAPSPGETNAVACFTAPVPSLARAAADEDDELGETRVEHILGQLAPLDCEAVLVLTADEVAIDVFEGATRLTEVRLGEAVVSTPTEGRVWHITLPRVNGDLQLVVNDAEGRSFQDLLAIRTYG